MKEEDLPVEVEVLLVQASARLTRRCFLIGDGDRVEDAVGVSKQGALTEVIEIGRVACHLDDVGGDGERRIGLAEERSSRIDGHQIHSGVDETTTKESPAIRFDQ